MGDLKCIYKKEQHKACFQHDMGYSDFKYLPWRPIADKILRDKTLNIARNPKYDGYQCGLASTVYTFFDKKNAFFADKSASNTHKATRINSENK